MAKLSYLMKTANELITAVSKTHTMKLREISNNAIKVAALENDRVLAEISLVAYCLHKLCSKVHIVRHGKWKNVRNAIISSLKTAVKKLKQEDLNGFKVELGNTISSIQSLDRQLGNYAQNLYDKARVKHASAAYAYGLSLSQAAELTGANREDLLKYIGTTRIVDREAVTFSIKQRLEKLKQELGD